MSAFLQSSNPSLLAVATGVIGSAWACGSIASISLISIPPVLATQHSTVQIWNDIYTRGKNLMPKVAVTVSLSYAYAAYDAHSRGGNWTGYVTAAALLVSIIPYTLTAMRSNITALTGAAKGTSAVEHDKVLELIEQWSLLNLARAVFPLASAVTGLMTLLSNLS